MCDLPVGLDTGPKSCGFIHYLRLEEFEKQGSLTNCSAFGRAARQFSNLHDYVATLDGLLESKIYDHAEVRLYFEADRRRV
jgi:hypothetical protein